MMIPNLPEGVFRFPKIKRGESPDWNHAEPVSNHETIREAMDAADTCRRADPTHTYCVADARALCAQ